MAYTIPADNHVVSDTGHTTDHNDIVDVLKGMGAAANPLNTAFAGGADPTGTRDSTAAIQAALLSFGTLGGSGSAGGIVYLPAGDYSTSKPLIIPSGVILMGAGWGTIIDLATGSNCDVIQFATYQSAAQATILGVSASSIANAFWAGVVNLQVHGDSFHTTVAGYHHGINITTSPVSGSKAPSDPDFDPHPLVRDVWIKACTGDALYHSGRSGGLFERVWASYCNGNGFSPSFDTTMVDCLAEGTNCGFYLNHGSDVGTGCKSYNNNDRTWVSGTSYSAGNVAVYSGTMYFCILAVSGSTVPSSDATHWTAVSATSPQATGTGFYWDTNAAEQCWAACDAQQNSTSSYYFKSTSNGAGFIVQGASADPNTNNGQAAYNSANPNHYAHAVFDGVKGSTVQIATTGASGENAYVCTSLNSPSGNVVTATTDGTETALFSGNPPGLCLVNGQIYDVTTTVNGNLAVNAGSFGNVPLISSEDGTTTSHGAFFHVLGNNGTESGHYLLWYDATDPAYIGLAMSLGAGRTYNGHPVIALGGYFNGWGVQGSSNGTGQPVFGVLNSAQTGNGLGHVAFTIFDNNETVTFKNTLDDGSGNSITTGVAAHSGGTDTSGTATASSPSFTSGTAQQLSTTQDVMLYIAVQTSATLAVAIGPTSTPATTVMPSKSYGLGLNTIRVPKGWWVEITGTIADLAITQVTC